MPNQPDIENPVSPVEQRINAQLEIIETRYSHEVFELLELVADLDIMEGEQRTELERVAAERANDAIFKLFLAIAKVPGIGIPRAKAAANQIMDRCGLKREVR